MSPSRVLNERTVVFKPINHGLGKLCNFDATVTGMDLNDLSDEDLMKLKEATHKHKVVVIKNQHNLEPIKHWKLVTRLDPTVVPVHGHGTVNDFKKTGGFLSVQMSRDWYPVRPNVRLVGEGYQGADSYDVRDFTAGAGASNDWHESPPSLAAFEGSNTQFQRWHMDAPLYDREPPHFTALRAVKLPPGPALTVDWDDGSRLSMQVQPGQTAFFSNVQLYELLSTKEQMAAENSWVECAPFSYMWMENCRRNSNGLGLAMQGSERSMDEMPERKPEFIKTMS